MPSDELSRPLDLDATAADPGRTADQPPVAERRDTERVHHRDNFVDPYEWLRDPTDPAVIAHLEAENAWTERATGHLADLRDELFAEQKARTLETDLSVPERGSHRRGNESVRYWYYSRTVEGSDYPIHCRVPAGDDDTPPDPSVEIAGEQVVLDENLAARNNTFYRLGALEVSPDGTRIAVAEDVTGAERYRLRFVDLGTGEALPDVVDEIAGSLCWADNSHVFFTRCDEAWRPHQLLRYALATGTAPGVETLVHTEPDERFFTDVQLSRDEGWVVHSLGSKLTSEVRLLPVGDPTGEFRVVAPRHEGVEYDVEVAGDRLLIVHNLPAEDGHPATDFALSQAPLDSASVEDWEPLMPHIPGVRLLGVDAYAHHAVVSLRRDGLTGLHVLPRNENGDFTTGEDLTFDERVFTVGHAPSMEWDTDRLRFHHASMTTPTTVWEADVTTGERVLLKRTPVQDHPERGPYRSEDYLQGRTWATAADGTMIPISYVHHRTTALDGTAPTVLYGYGSYEASMDPYFSIPRLSLLDRGFVYAIAHVRGGGEMGRAWYDNGKQLSKKNTFTDFIDCAHHLVDQRIADPERLAARGGSAGGLLMGAVANLAPHLFRAIQADVPFVDALTSILDPDLPLTVTEWDEWGDPLHDPVVYHYMKSYSPYENVAEIEYPAILATTSLNDTRVLFVEPAKWVAALRHTAVPRPDRPILLKTEMVAGHGGVSGRYNTWREIAFENAWVIDQLGATGIA